MLPQVAEEIWVCEKRTVTKWTGDILSYKLTLKKNILKEEREAAKAAKGGKAKSNTAKTGAAKNGKK